MLFNVSTKTPYAHGPPKGLPLVFAWHWSIFLSEVAVDENVLG